MIVIDCLRYEYHDYFKFDGFQLLNKTVSVSNWTMPVVATLMTGLHPLEHKCCLYPEGVSKEFPNRVRFFGGLKRESYRSVKDEMLIDLYKYKAVLEVPMLYLVAPGYPSERRRANDDEGLKLAREYMNDPETEFLYWHLKGAHSPYVFTENQNTPEREKEEVVGIAKRLNPFINDLKDKFDRIVVVSDHGQLWGEQPGHGGKFDRENLHIPIWLYPNENLPDELYDIRIAYNFLREQPTKSRQFVLSTTPAYGDYNCFAVTYLKDGKLFTDSFQTEKGWDLK